MHNALPRLPTVLPQAPFCPCALHLAALRLRCNAAMFAVCTCGQSSIPRPAADVAARLSVKEAQFARDYFVLFGGHMKAAAANHLPGAVACGPAGCARPTSAAGYRQPAAGVPGGRGRLLHSAASAAGAAASGLVSPVLAACGVQQAQECWLAVSGHLAAAHLLCMAAACLACAVQPVSTCRCSRQRCTAAATTAPAPPTCPPAADAFSSLVRQASAHPGKDMVPAPDMDRHVFCRVLEDRGNVTVDEDG